MSALGIFLKAVLKGGGKGKVLEEGLEAGARAGREVLPALPVPHPDAEAIAPPAPAAAAAAPEAPPAAAAAIPEQAAIPALRTDEAPPPALLQPQAAPQTAAAVPPLPGTPPTPPAAAAAATPPLPGTPPPRDPLAPPTAASPEGLGARPMPRELVEIRRGATEDQASHFLGDSIQDLRLVNGRVPLINLDLLNTTPDVKMVTEKIAHLYRGQIDEARRGVITHQQTIALADDLGMTVDDLLKGMSRADPDDPASMLLFERGERMDAEHIFAARRILVSVHQAMLDAAKKVQLGVNVTDEDRLALHRLTALSGAVQARVHGFVTEAARAMSAFRIPAGHDALAGARIRELLAEFGGNANTDEMAAAIVKLAEQKGSAGLAKFARETTGQKWLGLIQQAWINGLLSAFQTHAINIIGNSIFSALQPFERFAAAGIGSARLLRPGPKAVGWGEAVAQIHGMIHGSLDGIRLAALTAWRGDIVPRAGDKAAKGFQANSERSLEGNFRRDYWRAETWDMRMWGTTAMRALGIIQSIRIGAGATAGTGLNKLGVLVNSPSRALLSADQFFRSVGGRGELHARAWRLAREEGLRQGWGVKEIRDEYRRLLDEPVQEMTDAAEKTADYVVFQAPMGKISGPLSAYINQHPLLKFIFPFQRTPSNIFKASFGERTLLYRLNQQAKDELAAGGARRDIMAARISVGTTTTMVATYLAMTGLITGYGPADPEQQKALRATGWRPYSVVFTGENGKKYYVAYNRLEPVASLFAVAADFYDALRYTETEDWDGMVQIEKLLTAIVTTVTNQTLQKSYLVGLSDFIEVLYDPKRYLKNWMERFAGTVVPAGIAHLTRSIDPVKREVDTILGSITSRLPGLSDSLPPQRDLFGDIMMYDTTNTFWEGLSLPIAGWANRGMAQASPVFVSVGVDHIVEREIVANEARLTKPKRHIKGVKMTPQEYDDFMDFLGHGLLVIDVNGEATTLKKAMEALMRSDLYLEDRGGPDSFRTTEIESLYTEAVALARKFYTADPYEYEAMLGSIVADGYKAPDAAALRVRIKKRAALEAALGQPGVMAEYAQEQALRELEETEMFFSPLRGTPETKDAMMKLREREREGATP